MPSYAYTVDLTARMGRELTSAESSRVETLLDDASFWLSAWVPGLDEAITGGDPVLTEAGMLLVVAMVKRALAAPGAENLQQETAGVFTVRYRNPEGNLFVYGRELDTILALMTADRSAAVSYRSQGL